MMKKMAMSVFGKTNRRFIIPAGLMGYLIGVAGSLMWGGGMKALSHLLPVLTISPLGVVAAFDFWGARAGAVVFMAFAQFMALAVLARRNDKPWLTVVGSFLAAVMLGGFGGSGAVKILSW